MKDSYSFVGGANFAKLKGMGGMFGMGKGGKKNGTENANNPKAPAKTGNMGLIIGIIVASVCVVGLMFALLLFYITSVDDERAVNQQKEIDELHADRDASKYDEEEGGGRGGGAPGSGGGKTYGGGYVLKYLFIRSTHDAMHPHSQIHGGKAFPHRGSSRIHARGSSTTQCHAQQHDVMCPRICRMSEVRSGMDSADMDMVDKLGT